jgi:hypothetical protein
MAQADAGPATIPGSELKTSGLEGVPHGLGTGMGHRSRSVLSLRAPDRGNSPPREPHGLPSASGARDDQLRPQHFLYFLPEPHGHGSLRPTLPKLGAGVAGRRAMHQKPRLFSSAAEVLQHEWRRLKHCFASLMEYILTNPL